MGEQCVHHVYLAHSNKSVVFKNQYQESARTDEVLFISSLDRTEFVQRSINFIKLARIYISATLQQMALSWYRSFNPLLHYLFLVPSLSQPLAATSVFVAHSSISTFTHRKVKILPFSGQMT